MPLLRYVEEIPAMQADPTPRRASCFLTLLGAFAWLLACEAPPPIDFSGPISDWPDYGGTKWGERYSPLTQITRENARHLEVAWTYHTGDFSDGEGQIPSESAFEATPILVDGTLYVCTPFNRVIALEPETGKERWTYDPEINLYGHYANQLVCRGVATWLEPERGPGQACRRRILTATNDARLIALDAATGRPCPDFGKGGVVDLTHGVGLILWTGEYQVTSAPAIVDDLVVVGSAVSDNSRIDAPSGVVRAYDARTGALRWSWDPVPPGFERSARATTSSEADYVLGTANVWGPISVDEERDLVFVPTGNSAPDYYGGHRDGLDLYPSSVVALRGSTGEVVWSFQTVHHDLWDYDVPAQPTLTTLVRDGKRIPAVIQATKMGHVFILHRETGEPLFPVEERPVPQDGVPGEKLSPTQPFPVKPPPLGQRELTPQDAFGFTPWDRSSCRRWIASLRFDGIFTPPTLQGTVVFPSNIGGTNWGGVAVDPERQLLVTKVSNVAVAVTLIPRKDYDRESHANPGVEIAPQRGTPYAVRREALLSPLGIPCNPPPWGQLVAIELQTGEIAWDVTFGTTRDLAPVPISVKWGTPSIGGPLVTASGLIFIGAAMDNYIRAFDIETGEELWKGRLPAGGQASPMSFRLQKDSKQFVVIAAGGHAPGGDKARRRRHGLRTALARNSHRASRGLRGL
jgi:quinoprotein glucose dehydrogenase